MAQRARRTTRTPAQLAAEAAEAARQRLNESIRATARLAETFRADVHDLARRQCAAAAELSAHAGRVADRGEAVTAERRLHVDETWAAAWRGMRLEHEAQVAPRIL